MAINLTDSLNAATTKGKLGDAKQVFLIGDTKNLQQAHEETNAHLDTLDNRSTQMENAIKDISVSGGASTASAVSYDNSASKLEAVTAQGALDELKANIMQETERAQAAEEANATAIIGTDRIEDKAITTGKLADDTASLMYVDILPYIEKSAYIQRFPNNYNFNIRNEYRKFYISVKASLSGVLPSTASVKLYVQYVFNEGGFMNAAEETIMLEENIASVNITPSMFKDIPSGKTIKSSRILIQWQNDGGESSLETPVTMTFTEFKISYEDFVNDALNAKIEGYKSVLSKSIADETTRAKAAEEANITAISKLADDTASLLYVDILPYIIPNYTFYKAPDSYKFPLRKEQREFYIKFRATINNPIPEGLDLKFYIQHAFEGGFVNVVSKDIVVTGNDLSVDVTPSMFVKTPIEGTIKDTRIIIQLYGSFSGLLGSQIIMTFTEFKLSYADFVNDALNAKIEGCSTSLTNVIESQSNMMNIIYNGYHFMKHVKVKKDGTGDFTTIQDAINSITDASPNNQYDIQVYDDFEITDLKDLYISTGEKNTSDNPTKEVALIFTKSWVHIRGMKGGGNKLYIESPKDIASATFQYVQVIKPQGNCIINNFYVGIKGGRYAIHQESSGSKIHPDYHAHTIYMNLTVEHKGNSTYPNGSAWTSTMAQANGTTSGLKQTYINCKWISANAIPFYTHTNSEFDEPNEQTMINCSIICTAKNKKISDMNQYWGDIGSGQKSIIKFIGCNIARFGDLAGYGGVRGEETTRNVRVKYGYNGGTIIQGYSNTPMAVSIAHKPCLTFYTVNNNENIEVVGGTAYNLLWEKTWQNITGTPTNKGYCIGSIRLATALAWAKNSQVFCLPYILGNCVNSPKTLIVKVDDTEYILTFAKNYMTSDGSSYTWNTEPAISNSDIINDINSAYPDIFKASFNSPLQEIYTFEDCQEYGVNVGTNTIQAGQCLKRSVNGFNSWEIANEGDSIDGVAGELIIPQEYSSGKEVLGRILIPKKSYFNAWFFGVSGFAKGALFKAANGGKLQLTENKLEASFIAVDSEYLIGI